MFDKTQTLIAFGYEAEKMFREFSENDNHQEHYFFERFKMQLYNKSDDKKQKVLNNLRQKYLIKVKIKIAQAYNFTFLHIFFQKLTKTSRICDISGKELPAMYVFSKAIEYMHDHLLEELKKQGDDEIAKENIHWVLTVPAIWDDSAKQFMRDAAEQVYC